MSVPTYNEVRMTRHVRHYLQFNGALPTNNPQFYGQDYQYLVLDSASIPEFGTIAPVYVPNPRVTDGTYDLIQKTIAAPGTLPKATLSILERHGAVPRQLAKMGLVNIYEYIGLAKDLSDFVNGADDGVVIYSGGRTETKAMGKRNDWKADSELMDKLNLTFDSIYPIGQLGVGNKSSQTKEVVDVVYGSWVRTGEFGTWDDGTQSLYALVKGATNCQTAYSLDGGKTWTTLNITAIADANSATKIRVMGNYLIVLSPTENCYFYIALNFNTGAPVGSTWTKVTTGIVSSKAPVDMVVFNPREAYLCGLLGYVYKMTDPTAGVTVLDAGAATVVNLNAIAGIQDYGVLVAVGASQKVIISTNRGQSWAVASVLPGSGTLNSVDVLGEFYYWVCDDAGAAYYTYDGGASWTTVTLGSMNKAYSIKFATKEVGFIGGSVGGTAGQLWTTWNGGKNWTQAGWRIIGGVTTQQKMNTIAIPNVAKSDPETACDNIAIACLDATTTGAVALGTVSRV